MGLSFSSRVAETLFIPLYHRAQEAKREDAIIRDERAAPLVERAASLGYDFEPVRRIQTMEANKVARFMLTRTMDRYTRDFLKCHPRAAVVHIGCGLDTRFDRVDDGLVDWYDLDLPDVIALRRQLVGGESERYHLIESSAFDDAWFDSVDATGGRAVLFLAENVFVYFGEEEVRALVLKLCDRFPGAELVFDGWTPFFIWLGNRQLARTRFAGLLRWGFWRARRIERWARGVRLLGEWGFFDEPEPRLARYRWAAPLFRLLKPMRVLHYRLGGT